MLENKHQVTMIYPLTTTLVWGMLDYMASKIIYCIQN